MWHVFCSDKLFLNNSYKNVESRLNFSVLGFENVQFGGRMSYLFILFVQHVNGLLISGF
jgi:hypothetical protein